MIRVIVVDDHAILRRGLISILEASEDLSCVAEGSNAAETMRAIREFTADALVLDVSMPGKDGIEVLKQVKKEKPRLPVLILSSHAEEQYALRSIRAGASGYLNKSSAPQQLVAAIRQIASGRKYITPELAQSLADHIESPVDGPMHGTLSDREFQTLKLIGSGYSLTQVADKLCLSVKTVSVYRARLLEKMQMKNNAELTRYAIEQGLVD
ncbi:MAG: response regulator transcription factor [Burkholderiaceae bacterium]|jgi:DNA-binding NarL/FixJ family response regulator